jgi:hypothetical protein
MYGACLLLSQQCTLLPGSSENFAQSPGDTTKYTVFITITPANILGTCGSVGRT